MTKRKRRSNESFIKECKKVHEELYDYSKTTYTKMHNNVIVTCLIHGDFSTEANVHIRGGGCIKCRIDNQKNKLKDDTKSFVEKAVAIHGDKYDYSQVVYGKNAHEKIKIICPEHGEFTMSPNGHISAKHNCPLCARLKCGWTKTSWRKACKGRVARLYVIRCWDNEEEFYKIGITMRSIENRFRCKYWMPYNYELIEIVESENSDYIFNLERKLHKINKNKYTPKLWFGGFSECFKNYSLIH